jgi:hypothetical protein
MSTQTPPASAPPTSAQQEIVIVSHSTLFYWWPVWALGFIFFVLTRFSPYVMALVPKETHADHREVKLETGNMEDRDVLIVPKDRHLLHDSKNPGQLAQPKIHMSAYKNYGVVFTAVVLLVIIITNVPLRGMWSLMIIVVLIFLTILFWALEWWEKILENLDLLQIYINAGGYLAFAVSLLVVWVITFFFFDPQVYMVFTPGQLKVCQEIGGGEQAFPTFGISFQKQRSDLFRHWILGLGSGDLIVKTAGANPQHFEMHNVLFVGYKVKQIEEMTREQKVVTGA